MRTLSIEQIHANFSSVLKHVLEGEEIGILFGKKREMIARIVPNEPEKKEKRQLGILDGKVMIKFASDFKMTEEELLGS